MKQLIQAAMLLVSLGVIAACQQKPADNPNVELAKAWVTAAATGRAEAMAMVEANMADDGVLFQDRYVGFGFIWDNQRGAEEGRMIVTDVIPESPAAAVLQEGDEFVSVRGMEVNSENLDRLEFRGKPGEAVTATILRDGEQIDIEVSRGVISRQATKADMLEWMSSAEEEDWAPDDWKLYEAIGQGDVVYVWTQSWDTDDTSGLAYNSHQVTRFMFNDAGKVAAIANLSEDRFVLEQMGYRITR